MDNIAICKCIFLLVGTVQLVKNLGFAPKMGARFWALVSILTGVAIGISAEKLPAYALDTALIVAVGTLFYDTIYKRLEKWAHSLTLPGGGTNE